MPGVACVFMETRGMRRHDERRVADARSGRRAAFVACSCRLGLFLIVDRNSSLGRRGPGRLRCRKPGYRVATADGAASVDERRVKRDPDATARRSGAVPLKQQDAEDATAGATGESGTVNGVPRETTEAAPVTTGPGAPLAPGEVMLPPSVPGLPAPGVDPAVAGAIGVTTEVAFDAVSDTTVFTYRAERAAVAGERGAARHRRAARGGDADQL